MLMNIDYMRIIKNYGKCQLYTLRLVFQHILMISTEKNIFHIEMLTREEKQDSKMMSFRA